MIAHTKMKDEMTDKEDRDLRVFLGILKEVANDPHLREKMEEDQRKYGTLTEEELRRQFTI
jgi:hypothetical protein